MNQEVDKVVWKVARTLWAIRILYICGDRKDYNDRLTGVENFGLQNNLFPDTYLVRAAKALAKSDEEKNVERFTKPSMLQDMQATGRYLLCLMYRDQRTTEGLAKFAETFNELKSLRSKDKRSKRLVAGWVFKKLEGDLSFLRGVQALSALSPERQGASLFEPALDRELATSHLRNAIGLYKQAKSQWRPSLLDDFCIPLTYGDGEFTYKAENLSSAFSAIVSYHIGLANAWLGNFSEANKALGEAAAIAKSDSDEPTSWLLPYLLAVILRDQATVQLLQALYPRRAASAWTFLDLATVVPQSFKSGLEEYIRRLDLAIKAAEEAARRFNYKFDSHPICSAKREIGLKYIDDPRRSNLRESDLTVMAWFPHPGHSASMYDPQCTDIIAALVSTDKDQYQRVLLPEDSRQLLPEAFRLDEPSAEHGSHEQSSPDSAGPFVFSALRDWASSIPLLRSFSPRIRSLGGSRAIAARGGGYVVSCKEQCFVLDPGYDFVSNYTEQGFDLGAVKAILVSHDHPDHNSDLMRLDDLIYEYRRRSRKPPKVSAMRKSRSRKSTIAGSEMVTEPRLEMYLDRSTASSWAKRCEALIPRYESMLEDTRVKELSNIGPGGAMTSRSLAGKVVREGATTRGLVELQEQIQVRQLPLYREGDREGARIAVNLAWWTVSHTIDGALGYSFDCLRESPVGQPAERLWKLGYSGDCRYEDYLVAEGGPMHNCDVLLLHLSQPDLGELVSEGRFLKSDHLGFYGALRIASLITPRPKVVLLGEFWGGRGDLRLTIASEFAKRLNLGLRDDEPDYVVVLPTSQGLHLDLESKTILCNYCFMSWSEARAIELVRSAGPYSGFFYLCPKCRSQVSRSISRA